jgi:ABC-type transport system substrate-binding protein
LLDAVVLAQPHDPVGFFRARITDHVLTRDRRDAAAIRDEFGGRVVEAGRFEDSPVLSTFATDGPPWNNPELVAALSGALHRQVLLGELFGGRAAPAAPIPPVHGDFALSPAELAAFPGYGDADADAREARARWEAAGGPGLGDVHIEFPSIFDPRYSASSVVVARLNSVLGRQFRAAVETYTAISEKARNGAYGNGNAATWFGWGPPFVEPDPSRWLLATYAERGLASVAGLDGLAGRLAREFSMEARKGLAREFAKGLLAAGGGGVLNWGVQRMELFSWPYLKAAPPTPFWNQGSDARAHVDPSAGGYGERQGTLA